MVAAVADDNWEAFGSELEAFSVALGKSKAVNVNTQALRDSAKQIVQRYFRGVRPRLTEMGFSDAELQAFDAEMQSLLELTQGRNAKKSYTATLRRIKPMRVAVETQREIRLGQQHGQDTVVPGTVEHRIVNTLTELVPAAAASYQQALQDLEHPRSSYRGTAVEMREALRETLDHLAPNSAVTSSEGFRLERDRSKPTYKQKVRYLLKSRDVSKTARAAPEGNVDLIEELTGSLTRATYERGSLATHTAPTEGETRQLKMYVDSVLAELLEIHG